MAGISDMESGSPSVAEDWRPKCSFMALPIAKALGIDRALIVCDKDNPASSKTILRCGGILEDERFENGKAVQRYWIQL